MNEDFNFIEYNEFNSSILHQDLKSLYKIALNLRLPQKIIYNVFYYYYKAKKELKIEPDNIVLFSACIDLTCKVFESYRPSEKILEKCCELFNLKIDKKEHLYQYIDEFNKTEIDICKINDFNFDISNLYSQLQNICTELKIDKDSCIRAWIILNDILIKLPLILFFKNEMIIYACIYITQIYKKNQIIKMNEKNKDEKKRLKLFSSNNDYLIIFINENKINEKKTLEFLINEILNFYVAEIEKKLEIY